jgi:NitT/TauT family transport system substrate-binding protein
MGMAIAGLGLQSVPACAEAVPSHPEAGPVTIGLEPWLGYGQWHIAKQMGYFSDLGLEVVELANFTRDVDINSALASGRLDAANVATHTALAMAAAGLPIKIVLMLDVSMTADAILTNGAIQSIAEIRGKAVAFEEGATSDILLHYVLAKNGMTMSDIRSVPMPAADAGAAMLAGRVPVAVTYEPYISLAKAQSGQVRLLANAGEEPGLISDVLVVRDEFRNARPGQIGALIKAWDMALAFYRANVAEGQAIIADAVGAKAEELVDGFEGVEFYSVAQNKEHLRSDFMRKVVPDVKSAAMNSGLLPGDVDETALIDPRFVDAIVG